VSRWLRHPLVWGSISFALVALVAWRSRAWELGDRFGGSDGRPILLAIALNLVILVAWAARSSNLLAGAGRPVGIRPLIPMTAFANTINNVTPGSVGELVRLYLLRAHHAVGYTTGAAVVVVERVVALGLLAASAAILWAAWWLGVWPPLAAAAIVLITLLPSAVYRVGIRPSQLIRFLPLAPLLGRERWDGAGRALERVDTAVAELLVDPRRAIAFGVWTAIVFTTYTSQLLLVATAIGQTIDPMAAWGALGLAIVAGVLSLLPFGLGSADLVLVGLLGVTGVPAAEAAGIAFGYRVVSTLPLGLAGVASYAFLSARLPHGHASEAAGEARAALAGGGWSDVDDAAPR
jgi:uncharacterized membrane protein YbhN (UPF0104 family)